MEKPPEELDLNKNYRFRVIVENNGARFAGELCLDPDVCTLVVRGDELEGRNQAFNWQAVDEMTCDGFNGAFLLYGLRGQAGSKQFIQRHPTRVTHFEVRYNVSHVIFGRGYGYSQPTFEGVDFHSPSIAQWVGYTHMQDTIVANYHNGTLFGHPGNFYAEFVQLIQGLGSIAIAYYPTTQYSVDEFSMGLQFVPVLSLKFDIQKTGAEVIDLVNEVETLFSFLFGMPLDLDKVKLITSHGRICPLSMYAPRAGYAHMGHKRAIRKYPFFPLGRNLRIDHVGLPPLPIESLSNYFALAKADRARFGKYLRYRHLENPEERFLGFFRLLEKLCFQKESYLPEEKLIIFLDRCKPLVVRYFDDEKNVERVFKRLVGWNNSKLDTAGCITRFMKRLPNDLCKRWAFGISDIVGICKLRNDLTHANEVEPEEYEVECKAKFIEALLVMQLLIAIGIPVDSAASIVPRLQDHFLIEKREDHHATIMST